MKIFKGFLASFLLGFIFFLLQSSPGISETPAPQTKLRNVQVFLLDKTGSPIKKSEVPASEVYFYKVALADESGAEIFVEKYPSQPFVRLQEPYRFNILTNGISIFNNGNGTNSWSEQTAKDSLPVLHSNLVVRTYAERLVNEGVAPLRFKNSAAESSKDLTASSLVFKFPLLSSVTGKVDQAYHAVPGAGSEKFQANLVRSEFGTKYLSSPYARSCSSDTNGFRFTNYFQCTSKPIAPRTYQLNQSIAFDGAYETNLIKPLGAAEYDKNGELILKTQSPARNLRELFGSNKNLGIENVQFVFNIFFIVNHENLPPNFETKTLTIFQKIDFSK